MEKFEFVRIEETKEEDYKGKVYDLRVKSLDHTYTVDDYIVHNCGGSLTTLCLGIASWAIDPIENRLLFERFVSSERLVTCMYKYYKDDWYVTKNRKYSFDDLKKIVLEKINQYPEYKERAILELRRAKWLEKEISIYDEIMEVDCDDRYVLPFFLGKTEKVDLSKPLDIVQIKQGGSGGLDIDTDFEPEAKEITTLYLKEKYGEDRVLPVGTYGTVGLASGIKDILRKAEVSFTDSNNFCKELNDELSFEENMENYKKSFPELYKIYEHNKAYLDMTPKILGTVRNCIPGEQLVNTLNGKKTIKEISKSSDKISYLNKKGEICYTDNYKKVWSGKKDVFEIELENGKKIKATEEHLFFTNHGLKKLKDLTEDDELFSIS